MSTKKTFRSQFNKVLEVDTYKDGSLSIGLGENEEPPFLARYHFDPAIAPALALAILEAAGIVPTAHDGLASTEYDKCLEDAAWEIRRIVKARERIAERAAKEAADREALEGEALALCNAFQDAGGYARADVMTTHHYDYGKWMDVARKAREIRGATK